MSTNQNLAAFSNAEAMMVQGAAKVVGMVENQFRGQGLSEMASSPVYHAAKGVLKVFSHLHSGQVLETPYQPGPRPALEAKQTEVHEAATPGESMHSPRPQVSLPTQ